MGVRFRGSVVLLLLAAASTGAAGGGLVWPAPSPPANPVIRDRDGESCATRVAGPCGACDDPRRGPIEVRDAYLLAQPLLTLPAVSPDTLGCGRTSIRGQFVWGNTFGWRQNESGESPARRYFLVDGETRTAEVSVARGVTADVDLGARLALHWRGGGVSDDVIDTFHESLSFLGLTDNKRSDFRRDAFRIEGRLEDGGTFDASADKGVGLGNLELSGKWRFVDGGRDRWSWAAIGRVTLPTGSGPFDPDGFEAGVQLAGARRLARDWDLYAGVGAVGRSEREFQGIAYSDLVGHAFVAAEWRFATRWSLLVESDYATNLADGVERHDVDRWYLGFGAKVDVAPGAIVELGFVENLISQQTTTDIAIHFGIELRF